MHDRPYTLLSCSMSIDGYLGSAAPRRLELSNKADFDRVDSVRATCDAIMVGAATVRTDNPRLLVRAKSRREKRAAQGLPPSPIKVTLSERLELDPFADFFTTGETEKLVYCASPRVRDACSRLGTVATVVDSGQPVEMRRVSEDLAARGVRRLMVEGGGKVHTQFLTENLADELQLVVAPFFVGDSRAPRFVSDGRFPWTPAGGRRLPRSGRLATLCCCATRSHRGSRPTDRHRRCLRSGGPDLRCRPARRNGPQSQRPLVARQGDMRVVQRDDQPVVSAARPPPIDSEPLSASYVAADERRASAPSRVAGRKAGRRRFPPHEKGS